MATTGTTGQPAEEFWENRYRERDQIWSGRVNAVLAEEAADLAPGRALDVGCGEGADAIWLAHRGWRVTAVDLSRTALERAAAQAAAEGVADRIELEQHDLATSFPAGTFDLVSAQYLHTPVELPRAEVLRRAASAVAAGGSLLVVGHADFPPWAEHRHEDVSFPTPDEVVADLRLDPAGWTVLRCEAVERDGHGPAGVRGTLRDSVVLARRTVPTGG